MLPSTATAIEKMQGIRRLGIVPVIVEVSVFTSQGFEFNHV